MLKQRIRSLFENPDGSVLALNKQKLYEAPFHITPNAPNVGVPMNANQSSAIVVCPVSGEGPAEIETLAIETTGVCQAYMHILDGDTPMALSNLPVHVSTIFGTGAQPFRLPQALYLDEQRSLHVQFSDLSGAGNVARPAFHCGRYLKQLYDPSMKEIRRRLDQRNYVSVPYFYVLDTANVTVLGGAAGQATISIGTDHYFEVHKITGISTGRYTLNIVDLATGESFWDAFGGAQIEVSDQLVVGSANFPYILQEPRLLTPGTKLLVTVTDTSAAPNTIVLTLSGLRLAARMWR